MLGVLILEIGLGKAVISEAPCVRQTLNHRIEKTLGVCRNQLKKDRKGHVRELVGKKWSH